MRAIGATTTALLGVAALAPTAPTAAAAVHGGATPFGFTVTPSTVAPGGRVTLGVTNCASSATVSSAVFDTVTVPSGRTAAATVDWDAKRGAVYQVSFTCNGTTGRTNLTIARAASTPTGAPTRAPTRAPTVAATSAAPAGVRGGLGGSVGGVGSGELATGTALVVAAAAGSAWTVRRRTEGRAH